MSLMKLVKLSLKNICLLSYLVLPFDLTCVKNITFVHYVDNSLGRHHHYTYTLGTLFDEIKSSNYLQIAIVFGLQTL